MALDYLAIQGSAVPCERAFSSGAETDTKRRNRLGPTMFEALQFMKSWYKHDRMDFMKPWTTPEHDMRAIVDLSEDPLAKLMSASAPNSAIDAVIAAVIREEGLDEDHD